MSVQLLHLYSQIWTLTVENQFICSEFWAIKISESFFVYSGISIKIKDGSHQIANRYVLKDGLSEENRGKSHEYGQSKIKMVYAGIEKSIARCPRATMR